MKGGGSKTFPFVSLCLEKEVPVSEQSTYEGMRESRCLLFQLTVFCKEHI